jgi:predicted RNA methylase
MPALSPSPAEGTERDPDALSAEFEAGMSRSARRQLGVFNTPLAVARDAVAAAIDRPGTVCDPSCGTGSFLVAAGERLVELGMSRADAAASLIGVDVDASAVALAAARVAAWSGGVPPRTIVGDGLAFGERVDFVVGNPPFVDRLHARFLEHATRLADVVAMIVPTSLLATNDGRAARASGIGVGSMTRLGPVFDADVDTCVLVLRRDAPVPSGPTWSSLLADAEVPRVALPAGPTIGDECDVVAGFRQHYYALRGCVREGGDGLPPVTSGAIEPGRWGVGSVRFDRVRYDDPRVVLDDVVDDAVRSWFLALLRPKVVVATQTRVIEAAADEGGVVVPSVPVISAVPRDAARVWHVLAVLLAPPVTAWAFREWGGTALAPSALKLGAPQVRAVPLPSSAGASAWDEAAAVLAGGGDLRDAGALMCAAYGAGADVMAWWSARLR